LGFGYFLLFCIEMMIVCLSGLLLPAQTNYLKF
jgi:hypothetical protein